MKIETKFDVGQKCFIMQANKIVETTIKEISIYVYRDNPCQENNVPHIRYGIKSYLGELSLTESDMFKTKEELINAL